MAEVAIKYLIENFEQQLALEDFDNAAITFKQIDAWLRAFFKRDIESMTDEDRECCLKVLALTKQKSELLQTEAKKLIELIAPFNKNEQQLKGGAYRG